MVIKIYRNLRVGALCKRADQRNYPSALELLTVYLGLFQVVAEPTHPEGEHTVLPARRGIHLPYRGV